MINTIVLFHSNGSDTRLSIYNLFIAVTIFFLPYLIRVRLERIVNNTKCDIFNLRTTTTNERLDSSKSKVYIEKEVRGEMDLSE